MFQINLNKLTPFDTQVITMVSLAPGKVMLGTAPGYCCHHADFGWFKYSLYGFGAQLHNDVASTSVRQLSWRGQVLLRREATKIRRSAIDTSLPEESEPNPASGPFSSGGSLSNIAGSLMAQQAQAMNMLGMQQAQMGARPAPGTATATATAIAAQQALMNARLPSHAADAFKYAAIAVPQQMEFYGLTRDELLARGANPSLVADAMKAFPADPGALEVQMLADWCVVHIH